jgi:hypothetical protein
MTTVRVASNLPFTQPGKFASNCLRIRSRFSRGFVAAATKWLCAARSTPQ